MHKFIFFPSPKIEREPCSTRDHVVKNNKTAKKAIEILLILSQQYLKEKEVDKDELVSFQDTSAILFYCIPKPSSCGKVWREFAVINQHTYFHIYFLD